MNAYKRNRPTQKRVELAKRRKGSRRQGTVSLLNNGIALGIAFNGAIRAITTTLADKNYNQLIARVINNEAGVDLNSGTVDFSIMGQSIASKGAAVIYKKAGSRLLRSIRMKF